MSSPRSRFTAPAVVAATIAAVLGGLALAQPAFADDYGSTTEFVETAPVTADFGDDWRLTIRVGVGAEEGAPEDYDEVPDLRVGPASGTVDVYVDGIPGAYATGLPLQETGIAYFAQPTAQPLLAAGTHTVRAIFNPLAGSHLVTSQTLTPATLIIAPLTVDVSATARVDASVDDRPILAGTLAGSYVEKRGGAPAGTWAFTVRDDEGGTVFEREVAQVSRGTDPVVVAIDADLAPGTTFSVDTVFTPHPSLAQGLDVAQAPTGSFTSAGATLAEVLVAPVPLAWWIVAVAGAVLLLLVGAVIWLSIVTARRRRPHETATTDESAVPGTPTDDEPDQEAGLDEPAIEDDRVVGSR